MATLDVLTARLPVDEVGRPAADTAPVARWAKAVDLCRAGLLLDGYSPSTVERVCKQVARFGRECGWAPWDVDAATVAGWLDRLECSTRQGYVYRTSLRTFYRWALRTGRVRVDPTAETSRLASERLAPDAWHAAIEAYTRHLAAQQLTVQTIRLRRYQLVRLADELPACGPWDVTTTDLVEWLAGHRWARGTTYSYRAVLRSFYGWARDAGLVETDPAAALPSVRLAPKMARPAPEASYREATRKAATEAERLMLRLAHDLGLRAGEICRVHTEDVQPGIEDAGFWLQVVGKGDRVRYLPLPDDLARGLQTLPAGWVFPGRGPDGHQARATVTRKLSRLLPDQWTAHTLRHSFATRAYGVDHDVFTVQRLLGHARSETTQIYVQVPESRMRALVSAAAGCSQP
ncbi:MAG: tyrosine-type recombinase/integrase [Propionicimonas sp.]|uniref:tyrosine-type recombinase/integrase n=1 Tax=Propionicimonas sp. TaxID=1955623 RepID=UPI003D13942A